tara:strand:- start:230 stop:613 length:384 start_codon:yes stop_codon:yes gene_type:complete
MMNKCLTILALVLGLISCTDKGEQYYRLNPKALQEAVQGCPQIQPQGLSCEQLDNLAKRLAQLAYKLQSSPQVFGLSILDLQQTVSQQEKELLADPTKTDVKELLEQNKIHLADSLAVVKWLESPES